MRFYCGMDLSARECQVCVIDEDLSILVQEKARNELPRILHLIEPFKENLVYRSLRAPSTGTG